MTFTGGVEESTAAHFDLQVWVDRHSLLRAEVRRRWTVSRRFRTRSGLATGYEAWPTHYEDNSVAGECYQCVTLQGRAIS